jgi:pilus assembly protein CpaF
VMAFSEVQDFLHAEGLSVSSPGARELAREKLALDEGAAEEIFGHGPLARLLGDSRVSEILVNGFDEIWVESSGRLEKIPASFSSDEALRRWARKILVEKGRKFDHSAPFADCTLADGSRVHVAGPPIARKGVCVSIRKFPPLPWSLEALAASGSISAVAIDYLRRAVKERRNIFLSGGTGTGKTSLLGALLGEVPPGERILALEDIAEIKVNHPHFLSLEARPPNQEGEGEISLGRLLKESLRMRPDRLVIGECRGAEALELLLALNTGHAGSMGTIHANSTRDALQRLETLGLLAAENLSEQALKNLIVGGVHLVVQLERTPLGRKVASIAEVKGVDGGRILIKEISL